jgi:soluble lytic murein transglycosylase-like protein
MNAVAVAVLAIAVAACAQKQGFAAANGGKGEVKQARMTAAAVDCDSVSSEPDIDPWKSRRERYQRLVQRAGDRYGVDPALIDAVITVESGYNPRSVNARTGAAGLMQLMPETARRYKVSNVFDPAQNVRAGTQYLAELMDTFDNDPHLVLAAYLAGEGAVLKYGTVPPFRAARHYVPKVIRYYHRFRCAT